MKIDSSNSFSSSVSGLLGVAVGKKATGGHVVDAPLRQAAADFESLFINQMFQAMRRSVPQSKLFGGSSGETLFREMLDAQWASNLANAGGLGIGELLYRQLAGEDGPDGQEVKNEPQPRRRDVDAD